MNHLNLVYFYEKGNVYIFIKEEEHSNVEYYYMREIAKSTTELNEKDKMLQSIKLARYVSLLKSGYEYSVLDHMITQSKDVVGRYGSDGMSWLYSEKQALNDARKLNNSVFINSHVKRLANQRKKK